MSDAFERLRAQFQAVGQEIDHSIKAKTGEAFEFTLIVWDNKAAQQNELNYIHVTTMTRKLIPLILRRVADRFEKKGIGEQPMTLLHGKPT